MRSCPHNNKLTLYVYDELTESERANLEAHLVVCSSCREDLVSLQQLKSVPRINVGENILQPTRRALFYKLRSKTSRDRQQPVWWRAGKLVLQTGLALVLVFFGFKLGQQSAPAPSFAIQDLLTASNTIAVKDGTISPYLMSVDKITIKPDGTVEMSYNTVNKIHLQARADDPAVQDMLYNALMIDDDPIVRQRAVKTVQQLLDLKSDLHPEYVQAFEAILKEETNLGLKLAVIDILRTASASHARDVLVNTMLRDKNEAVRIQAFKALMNDNFQFSELDTILTTTKSDSNTYIRTKSLELLKQNKGTSL